MSKKSQPKKRALPAPPVVKQQVEPLRLDLGSGPRPAEGFKGVDIVKGITDFEFDLSSPYRWPWEDNSVDELRSSHFIEHLPPIYHTTLGLPKDAFFHFFDEAYRVAKPGATFTLIWPALKSVRAFQDPTHRRFIPADTLAYLSKANRDAMGLTHYNVDCNWITHHCVPTIRTDFPREAPYPLRSSEVQQRLYSEAWDFAQDFAATLKKG